MAGASLVQISDRLSFGPQRTNVFPCDDVTSQSVNFVTLGRRPTAKILHALQQAQPEDLSIFTYACEIDRILARRNGIAGRKFEILPGVVGKCGRAANDAIDNDLALVEKRSVRCARGALRQQRLA